LPEEEALFKEFQAYVHAISTEASKETLSELNASMIAWRTMLNESEKRINSNIKQQLAEFERRTNEVITKMESTVEQSRTNYVDLFAPAVSAFEAKSTALAESTHQIIERESKEWNLTHWKKISKNLTWLLAGLAVVAALNVAASVYIFTHR